MVRFKSILGKKHITGTLGIGLILPALLLLVWGISTLPGGLPEYVLPSPRELALTRWDFFGGSLHRSPYSGAFWRHALASSERVAVGFFLAAVIGMPLGLAAGSIRNVERLVDMSIQAIRSVPGIGWLPLAMIWFGIGNKTTVFLIAMAGFFPISRTVRCKPNMSIKCEERCRFEISRQTCHPFPFKSDQEFRSLFVQVSAAKLMISKSKPWA